MRSHLRGALAAAGVIGLIAAITAIGVPTASAADPGWTSAAQFPIAEPFDIVAGSGSVFVHSGSEDEYAVITRINPSTDRTTATWTFPDGSGGLTYAYGSIWLTQYNANLVLRISPRTGRVQARVRVGLQPEAVHAAFGQLWVANHHGQSVSRIDPGTNRVVSTVTVGAPKAFRDGPQDITDDGHRLYVGASIDDSLTTIDPVHNRVVKVWRSTGDNFCGQLQAAPGELWSADACASTLYRLDPAHNRLVAITYGSAALNSESVDGAALWVAYDRDPASDTVPTNSGGALDQRSSGTGRRQRTLAIGGDAYEVRALFGDLWVADPTNNDVRRIHVRSPQS